MDIRDYRAKQVRDTMNGVPNITDKDLVDSVMIDKSTMKREVIVDEVSLRTGVCKEDISPIVSKELKELEKEGKVERVNRGYWKHL